MLVETKISGHVAHAILGRGELQNVQKIHFCQNSPGVDGC